MKRIDVVDDIMSNPSEDSRKEKYDYCMNNLILFATDDGGNWDIFARVQDGKCYLYSVAKPGSGASNSCYGDCNHVRHLQRRGYWSDELTDAGRELMAMY